MHSVNLDLLRASSPYHADGQRKDPHARHRAEHLASLRAARRDHWLAAIASALGVLSPSPAKPETCTQVVVPHA